MKQKLQQLKKAAVKNCRLIFLFLAVLFFPSCNKGMYRVAFKSKITWFTSHGEWNADKKLIKEWVDYGNAEYPEIVHWVEKK